MSLTPMWSKDLPAEARYANMTVAIDAGSSMPENAWADSALCWRA
jgi:hypothetical protein